MLIPILILILLPRHPPSAVASRTAPRRVNGVEPRPTVAAWALPASRLRHVGLVEVSVGAGMPRCPQPRPRRDRAARRRLAKAGSGQPHRMHLAGGSIGVGPAPHAPDDTPRDAPCVPHMLVRSLRVVVATSRRRSPPLHSGARAPSGCHGAPHSGSGQADGALPSPVGVAEQVMPAEVDRPILARSAGRHGRCLPADGVDVEGRLAPERRRRIACGRARGMVCRPRQPPQRERQVARGILLAPTRARTNAGARYLAAADLAR